jgi:type I site-specific restriction endonuclease
MERELDEGRLKAKRDALTQDMLLCEALEQVAEVQQRFTAAKQCAVAAEQRSVESERQRIEVQQHLDAATMQRDAATMQRDEAVRQASKFALVGQIQLCERLIGTRRHGVGRSAAM